MNRVTPRTDVSPKRGRLNLLVGATALALVANQMVAVALPWMMLERTGRALDAGWLGLGMGAALVVGGFVGGTFADRVGPWRTAGIADGFSALTSGLIAVLSWSGVLPLGILFSLAIVGALLDPAGASARETALPAAAERARVPLERANAWIEAAQGVAVITGPALGGVLIAVGGAELALAVSGGLSALTALTTLVRQEGEVRRGGTSSWWEGWRQLRRNRVLWIFCWLGTFWMFAQAPLAGVVWPVVFHEANDPGGLGKLLAAFGVGGVIGALWYGRNTRTISPRAVLLVGLGAEAVGLAVLAWIPTGVPLLIVAALTGMAAGPVMPLANTEFQRRAPRESLGRVLGTSTALAMAAAPLGMPLAAWVTEQVGTRGALLATAVVFALVAAAAAASRTLRHAWTQPRASHEPSP